MKPVIVVGAGWAGISAACSLSQHGIPVTLLEASPQLGGRARSITVRDTLIDNGQHVFMGAYTSCRSLLQQLSVPTDEVFKKIPFEWYMQSSNQNYHLRFANLPKPWHAIWGFLFAKGWSFAQKQSFQKVLKRLVTIEQEPDQSVAKTLIEAKQSKLAIETLWAPLTLAALTTPIETASTHIFARVLKDALTQTPVDAQFWLATKDLTQVLPKPANDYLKAHKAQVKTHHRVTELWFDENQLKGVITAKGRFEGNVVLACSLQQAKTLLEPIPCLQPIANDLNAFKYESISTVYLQYPKHLTLPKPMIGMINTQTQWLFDRAFAGQPGLLSAVISGNGPHLDKSKNELTKDIAQEIKNLWPSFNTPVWSKVVHEKKGAFSACVGINQLRPSVQTPLPNLTLAGDYCQGPYPSTLEGAVASGQQSAHTLLRNCYESSKLSA